MKNTLLLISTIAVCCFSNSLNAQTIAAGARHSMAICVNGKLNAWGHNDDGELGVGTSNFGSNLPQEVNSLDNITSAAGGEDHSLALKTDGTVWTWGRNLDGELGNGTTNSSSVAVQVIGITNIVAIDGGRRYSIALKNDGTVWTWGDNDYGQLGNGTSNDNYLPIQVMALSGISAVAAGKLHAIVLKNDGTVWTWGGNNFGQLGNGTNGQFTDSQTPVQVSFITDAIAIAAGDDHCLALKSDGTVWAWGWNSFGQLGNGNTVDSNVPVQVASASAVISIDGGGYSSIALKSDGSVITWGRNDYGQLGNGTNIDSNIPVQVNSLSNINSIEEGGVHSLAKKNDGTLWAWGLNNYGELGNGNNTNSNTPVQVTGLCGVASIDEENKLENSFSIHPNPSNGIIYLSALNTQWNSTLEIYNLQGQLIFQSNHFESEIDLSNQPKGMYTVKLKSDNDVFIEKIIMK